MRILITNDDGIYSPGLHALAEVASDFGDIRIVAPDVERSSAGHSVTASRPLTYRSTPLHGLDGFEAYRVDGTPADCVALGAFHWDEVDVVLSGVNIGSNLGNSIWHSGTVAAAKQAALLGMRGIAFSAPVEREDPDFGVLKPWIARVLERLLPHDEHELVNVNFPREPRGITWARQSVRHYDGEIVPGEHPRGRTHFWFTVRPVEETEEDTDRWAVEHDNVALTPLLLDLTDHRALADLRAEEPVPTGRAAP